VREIKPLQSGQLKQKQEKKLKYSGETHFLGVRGDEQVSPLYLSGINMTWMGGWGMSY